MITRNSRSTETAVGEREPLPALPTDAPAAASGEPLAAARRARTIFPGTGAVHFSTRGEYGVRLMVELARHYGDGPISLA
ncbi:MAG TPA: hypothetical protein VK992_06190, partial [Candidatus Caenarcaniphilales bacterium]|nr:hypothetical protein [Candidatus Caenarcaniphilales bacterium]